MMRVLTQTKVLGLLLLAWCGAAAHAREVPQNLRDFYNAVIEKGSCANELATGFWATEAGPNSMSFFLYLTSHGF